MWFIQYEKRVHELVRIENSMYEEYEWKTRTSFHSEVTALTPSQWHQDKIRNLDTKEGTLSFDFRITFAILEPTFDRPWA